MAFLGRFLIGDALPLAIRTVDVNGVPVVPTATPYALIYDEDETLMDTVYLSYVDRDAYAFASSFVLQPDYAAASYMVIYKWTYTGPVTLISDANFRVLDGGSSIGTITSMRAINRVGGQWLLMHDISGAVTAGLRPH